MPVMTGYCAEVYGSATISLCALPTAPGSTRRIQTTTSDSAVPALHPRNRPAPLILYLFNKIPIQANIYFHSLKIDEVSSEEECKITG